MTAQAAEYRESLIIERKIKDNPALKEAWIKRQFQLELEDLSQGEASVEIAPSGELVNGSD